MKGRCYRMDRSTLRKVQLRQLRIAKEIIRVCQKNNIKVFMDSGTLIGAVRHKGFIPWDDDFDFGMLREDYERFNKIATKELGNDFFWQTWETDKKYALPFGKVREKNTLYLESKAGLTSENGFYVDILPYDKAPSNQKDWDDFRSKQNSLMADILMKCHYKPWIIDGKVNIKSRIWFFYHQLISLPFSRTSLIDRYNNHTNTICNETLLYQQTGWKRYKKEWFEDIVWLKFEDTEFPAIAYYHEWLTTAYGDYMTPPPLSQRENRHEIYKLDFGERNN